MSNVSKPVEGTLVKVEFKCRVCSATVFGVDAPPQKCRYCWGAETFEPLTEVEGESPSPMPQFMVAGSRAWLAEKMRDYMQEVVKVHEDGQKEYAHDLDNAFANFDRAGERLNIPPEKVLMIFLQKHLDGIYAHINGHTSQREDVRGRIKDAVCYLLILRGMFDARQ